MLVLDAALIDEADSRIDESVDLVNDILDENMIFLANAYLIPEVKRAAMAANVPKGFVDGIAFRRTGTNEGEVINTWGTEKKPLTLWFNYGTRDHGSLGNWPLHWKSKVTGDDIYAMYVRGVPKTEAMEIGIALGMKRLKEEGPRFVERQLQ